jgi:hypothetical protein
VLYYFHGSLCKILSSLYPEITLKEENFVHFKGLISIYSVMQHPILYPQRKYSNFGTKNSLRNLPSPRILIHWMLKNGMMLPELRSLKLYVSVYSRLFY